MKAHLRLAILLSSLLVANLRATVEFLDDQGRPLRASDACPGLREAGSEILDTLYGRRIVVLSPSERMEERALPSTIQKEGKIVRSSKRTPWVRLDAAAQDLAAVLKQMTGVTFVLSKEDAQEAIVLARADAPGLNVAGLSTLDGRGPEAFLIQSDGRRKLYLIGNSDLGIQHAIYAYLDRLGCRWFFAGDAWTILPRRSGIGVAIHARVAPAFFSRGFFGSGGLHSLGHLYDPEGAVTARWIQWKDRNRFGGAYTPQGHYYETFIRKNKALFEAHPEYRAEVQGKRVEMTPVVKDGKTEDPISSMKLCYSNSEVIDLFVKDRVDACKKILAKEAPKSIFTVSVEPSDGYGHCECANCRKLGSVTDRVFSLANHVARAIRPLSPYAYVNLYAYNMHSPPPNIALEPNMVVQVAAYGFNTSGLSSDRLIRAWGKTGVLLGVYDYWCIPVWGHDLPSLSFDDRLPKRLKFWHDHQVRSFNIETTYADGAVGPALYMLSRLGWEPDQDPKALFDDFYEKAFGAARAPMQRMLERWSRGWRFVDSEIAESFKDLHEALQKASDPEVKRRIEDYLGYVEYLRLRYEYTHTDRIKDRSVWIERCRQLIHHLYRIHHSCMAHTVWTSGLLFWGTKGDARPMTEEQLDVPTPRSSSPLSPEELDAILKNGLKTYTPVSYERKVYEDDDYAPLRPVGALSAKTRETPILLGDLSNKLGLWFWAPPGVPEILVSVRYTRMPPAYLHTPYDNFTVAVHGLRDKVFVANIPRDGEWHDCRIPTRESGLYGIRVLDNTHGVELRLPENLPLGILANNLRFLHNQRNPQDHRAFFWAPAGLKTAAFSLDDLETLEELRAADGAGKPFPRKVTGTTMVFDLGGASEPRICELTYPTTQKRLVLMPLNVSPMLSLFPENVLLPTASAEKEEPPPPRR
ncbi:MAG: DUF4838 domain-containing protein [Verrucomicrobiae bacterium]|nr:DUF4838 domain-containing protein [Verrucomicrobiae bacterium]